MNDVKNEKYGVSPNAIKNKSLTSERFKTLFNFERIKISKTISDRLDKYTKKKHVLEKEKSTLKFRDC